MNLMKLFNLKYLKENIKKSKGLLAFCLGIIPLINILVLIIIITSLDNRIEILDLNNISIITYIGLYIIPIILAVSLFGFVFKRKSVDFILSKPLSRSTIYITNIIGGILIITIYMILNSCIYLLFNLIFSNLIIPFSLIVDYFILFLISYIFIFIVSSLAITISGNLMGSIVLILIILCLIPFLRGLNIYYYDTHQETIYYKCDNQSCQPDNYNCQKNTKCINNLKNNKYHLNGIKIHNLTFTAPFYSLNNSTFYSLKSIVKMLILIPIYAIIGYYLFNKRKMENNETSFKNPKIHYLIKGITLIPVSFICYLIIKEANEIGFLISIFIIIIYSIIYDLITRKEIYHVLKSSLISFVTLLTCLGLYVLYDIKMNDCILTIKDITELNIGGITIKNNHDYQVLNKNIKGDELIKRILKETVEKGTEFKQSKYKVKTKGNQEYNLALTWTNETNKIIEEIIHQEHLAYFKDLNYNNINYVDINLKVTPKIKELIKETMLKIDNYSYEENNFFLEVMIYQNHKYEKFYIMPNLNQELDRYVMNEKNKLALKFLEKNDDVEFSTNNEFILFDYVINANKSKFINYLTKNNNELTTNYLKIYAQNNSIQDILIGDKNSFLKEYETYQKNLANDETYLKLLENYNSNNTKEEYPIEEKENYEY